MHVVVTGGAGFLGRRLITALLERGTLATRHGRTGPIDRITSVDIVDPPADAPADPRVRHVTGDISDRACISQCIDQDTASVFHLAAVVSGMAEADFDLGWRINLDATRGLLEACRAGGQCPRVVFASSVAVFGGDLPAVVPETWAPRPQTSYGAEKAIGELLVADYSRKGFIDGRALRLPTISVRPGRPNAAASSFASGIIREPLHGEESVCPVGPDTRIWLLSPATAIACLITGHELAPEAFEDARIVNLPGLTMTAGGMAAALDRIAGSLVAARITWRRDARIERMVSGWPGALDDSRARRLGFPADADFDAIVTQFLRGKLSPRSARGYNPRMVKLGTLLIAGTVAVAAVAASGLAAQSPSGSPAASPEWPTYGHDPGGMRFSPLTEITPANVAQLQVAWVYHMRPAAAARAGGAAAAPAAPQGRGRGGSGFVSSEVTPIVANGVMYIASPYGRIVALDPVTGEEQWVYALASSNPSTRGVEYWPGDAQTPAQIVFGSANGKLYSLDAKTGIPNEQFGDHGIVELNTPEILQGLQGNNGLSSPPVVFRSLVITGGRTQENPPHGPAGDVRAWDMHTGKLVWTFRSVPRPGEKYADTWAGTSGQQRSGVNVWGLMTVDAARGIVYLPFGAPSVDQYGGDRAGDNLFGTSLVAADANTGKYLWHFQVVHHDIWDGDLAGAPALVDVKQGGRTIPAVAVINKLGLLFLLDRVTGKPIYGVEERPVPQSEVPLERAAKTQPFPVKPAPLSRNSFAEADLATVTPELYAACKKLIEGVQLGGPYLPPAYNRLRVQFPGNHGGVNWGGTSFSPQLGYLFVSTNELGQLSGLRDRDPNPTGPAQGVGVGNRVDPDGPYQGFPGGGRFKDQASNMMCQQPPWGQLTAVNVNTGEFAWRVPLGVTDSLPPDKQKTGRPGNGGTIATAGGLVFVGATDDARFRAFDARTGQEVWTFKLGGAANATPSTYRGRDGRQYVVIVSTGGGFFEAPLTDDSLMAFAIKR